MSPTPIQSARRWPYNTHHRAASSLMKTHTHACLSPSRVVTLHAPPPSRRHPIPLSCLSLARLTDGLDQNDGSRPVVSRDSGTCDDVTAHHPSMTTSRVVTLATAIAIAIDRRVRLSSRDLFATRVDASLARETRASNHLHARGDSTRARRGASRAVVVEKCVSREVHHDETDEESIVDYVERGLDRDERDGGGGEVGDDAGGV